MPRFIVLKHLTDSESHFDLMLEQSGILLTFSFERFPEASANCKRIFDHRLRYLDFEGDIGQDRGTVERVDTGPYEFLSQTEKTIDVNLSGDRLVGPFRLTMRGANRWVLSRGDVGDACE